VKSTLSIISSRDYGYGVVSKKLSPNIAASRVFDHAMFFNK
jgi:hypothetical protein